MMKAIVFVFSMAMCGCTVNVPVPCRSTAESVHSQPSGQTSQDVANQIRQQCIQRQMTEHGLGGPVPNFTLCN